jgi:ATP-dependent RNA helicase DDX5/DBP2
MKEFKSSRCRIVCATDVASRGLDVRDISLVINYDFPNQIDNYVHRIGRTGRAGDKGKSITLITMDVMDPRVAKQLVDVFLLFLN